MDRVYSLGEARDWFVKLHRNDGLSVMCVELLAPDYGATSFYSQFSTDGVNLRVCHSYEDAKKFYRRRKI
jgi:hypothetical protein